MTSYREGYEQFLAEQWAVPKEANGHEPPAPEAAPSAAKPAPGPTRKERLAKSEQKTAESLAEPARHLPRNGRETSREKSRHEPVPEEDLPRLSRALRREYPWPDPLEPEAFYGFPGRFTKLVEPHTEADPAGVLTTVLIGIGNMIGIESYARVGATVHPPRDYLLLIGTTANGGKGESASYARLLFRTADESWGKRICGGLASGEGIIWRVRDPITRKVPIRAGGKKDGLVIGHQDEIVDPGIDDKRWLCIEPEFARVLQVCQREGNTLSCQLRDLWDFSDATNVVKTNGCSTTGAHVCVIGHITPYELRELLTTTQTVNGFFNRFVPQCVRRSKLLPKGGTLLELREQANELCEIVVNAKALGVMERDEEAEFIFAAIYGDLRAEREGLLGAVLARGSTHVLRLSTIYAATDGSPLIRKEHLLAAVAVWDRSVASARHIFGDDLGDPIADAIMDNLVEKFPAGVSRNEIRSGIFQRNIDSKRIGLALKLLEDLGMAEERKVPTGGRSRDEWFARLAESGHPIGLLPKARKAAEEYFVQTYAKNAVSPSQAGGQAQTFRGENATSYAESPSGGAAEIEEGEV